MTATKPPAVGRPHAAQDPGTTAVVGRRCAQALLDRSVVIVAVIALGVACFRLLAPGNLPALLTFIKVVLLILFVLAIAAMWFFDTWWPYRHGGQTPAMRWLGLRVITATGGPAPLWSYFIRTLLLLVDGFACGVPGLILMIVTPKHQRLGDMLAGTIVVRTRTARRGRQARRARENADDGPVS
jgi:uncharacterized RDD family membrane protein YckC